jgi:hypothetical protein
MAGSKTTNLGLTVYPDITGVYQKELRQSYDANFELLDQAVKKLETSLHKYVEDRLGEIENASY